MPDTIDRARMPLLALITEEMSRAMGMLGTPSVADIGTQVISAKSRSAANWLMPGFFTSSGSLPGGATLVVRWNWKSATSTPVNMPWRFPTP